VGVLALLSVGLSVGRFVRTATGYHTDYAGLSATERESSVVAAAGLPVPTWEFIRRHVRSTDRYVVRTPDRLGTGFHRYMQTFAGYWLLPAVAVTSSDEADVVVYLRIRAPGGAVCRETPELACVRRRGS
jgi:hypothetical protein